MALPPWYRGALERSIRLKADALARNSDVFSRCIRLGTVPPRPVDPR